MYVMSKVSERGSILFGEGRGGKIDFRVWVRGVEE